MKKEMLVLIIILSLIIVGVVFYLGSIFGQLSLLESLQNDSYGQCLISKYIGGNSNIIANTYPNLSFP